MEVPFEMPDTDDLAVAIELTDSLEALRLRLYSDGRLLQSFTEGASDGRLGGRAGDCSDGLLGGRLGPVVD